MSIAVQTAVGDIGSKAVTDISWNFAGLINCGAYQFGVNENGIYLLNYGNSHNEALFSKSLTFVTSDFGLKNIKRFRYIYLEIEVYGDSTFIVSVKPDKGSWINKTVSVVGAGLKTIRFSISRTNGQGYYHTVKIASEQQFRLHASYGLLNVRSLGI